MNLLILKTLSLIVIMTVDVLVAIEEEMAAIREFMLVDI